MTQIRDVNQNDYRDIHLPENMLLEAKLPICSWEGFTKILDSGEMLVILCYRETTSRGAPVAIFIVPKNDPLQQDILNGVQLYNE